MRLDLLKYKEEYVTYGLGLVYKGTYLAYQTAFDKRFSRLSPGKVLLHYLLIDLKRKNYKKFDFARGYSLLKKEFTKKKSFQYDVYVVKNQAIYIYLKLINIMRRLHISLIGSKSSYDSQYLFKTL